MVLQIPWLYPVAQLKDTDTHDSSHITVLSEDQTMRLCKAARDCGATVTHVVTALGALAHAEMEIAAATAAGGARYEEVVGPYQVATTYLVAFNFINHVR